MFAIGMSVLLALATQTGQDVPKSEAPPQVDCSDAAHSAIGYWVGDWIVLDTASSTPVAESRIEWVVDGCAIRETYQQKVGPNGQPMHYVGTSYSAYDASAGQWKQFYVDTTGRAAWLIGTLQNQRLVLDGQAGDKRARMTIEALANGDVRQRGEASIDGGAQWKPTFDFTYRKK